MKLSHLEISIPDIRGFMPILKVNRTSNNVEPIKCMTQTGLAKENADEAPSMETRFKRSSTVFLNLY